MTVRNCLTGSFSAMGTEITLTGVGIPSTVFEGGLEHAKRSADRWETMFSRFRPESELSRLNRAMGRPIQVSDDFIVVLSTAIAGVRSTNGRFNPAVLTALESLGYDRTFAEVGETDSATTSSTLSCPSMGWIDTVEIDIATSTLTLPPGLRLDFGGLAKGAFVDRLAADFADWPGGYIDAGGDLKIWGTPPGEASWRIGVEHPLRATEDIATLIIPGGAPIGIATSATNRRSWNRSNQVLNHLIDPATGDSIAETSPQVTVVSRQVVTAEILTKSILVALDRDPIAFPEVAEGNLALLSFEGGNYETIVPGQIRWNSPQLDAQACPAA